MHITRSVVLLLSLMLLPVALSNAADIPQDPSVHRSFMMMYRDVPGTASSVPAPAGYTIQPLDHSARKTGLKKEVFGYLPYWFRSRWTQIDLGLVSTVAYFSGEIAADGSSATPTAGRSMPVIRRPPQML